jgi:hypothetical protein
LERRHADWGDPAILQVAGGRSESDASSAEHYWLYAIERGREIQGLPNVLASLIRLAQARVQKGDLTKAYETATPVLNHPASWQDSKNRAAA